MKNVTNNPKVCARCEIPYQPTSNRQKFCEGCKAISHQEANKERCTARYRRTYVRKGYNQAGENNNAYKTGIGNYKQKALEHYGAKCMDCGSEEHICVHHSDEDRTNNELSNLEILCRSCHAIRHDLYTNFTVKKV